MKKVLSYKELEVSKMLAREKSAVSSIPYFICRESDGQGEFNYIVCDAESLDQLFIETISYRGALFTRSSV